LRPGAAGRVAAIMRKDAAELTANLSTLLPAIWMAIVSVFPGFLVAILAPLLAGETLAESEEFAEGTALAVKTIPELAALDGNALIQGFLFHQFSLLILMVPVVGSMAIAAHAVIGEKLARTLEPLLATPISTAELLIAKAMTPLVFGVVLMWITLAAYIALIGVSAEPGVWQTMVGPRMLVLFFLVGPLITVTALMLAVVISSRVNDPRSAQQLGALVVMPVTAVFVGQLIGQFLVTLPAILQAGLVLVVINLVLGMVGVRLFDRERILMRWK
jgi:ABC-2 type transport system permease protein